MAFRSGFFTSDSWTVNGDGFAIGNKAEGSDFFAKIIGLAVGNGVPYLPSSNLQCTVSSGMNMTVGAGYGFKVDSAGGAYMAWETTDLTISFTSDTVDQTFYISARLDVASNEFTGNHFDKYTSFVSATDLCIAKIVIPANAVSITNAMITDYRGNYTYCGHITDKREELDALIIYLQKQITNIIGGVMPDHAATHATGGDDELDPSDIGAASLDANSKVAASETSSYINEQAGSYTAVLGDAGKLIKITKSTACTFTIPTNASVAFPVGTEIEIVQYGAGRVTIVATSGVTLRNADSALKIEKIYCSAALKKIGTDEWLVSGRTVA